MIFVKSTMASTEATNYIFLNWGRVRIFPVNSYRIGVIFGK